MKTVSKEEYQRRVELASPPSPVGKDCLLAFLFGGAICTLGQALCNLYQSLGLELPQARTGVSISLIFLSALLTAMVSPALEFKSEGFVNGLGAKLFFIAGPVLVYGITASVVYGLVLFVWQWLGGSL